VSMGLDLTAVKQASDVIGNILKGLNDLADKLSAAAAQGARVQGAGLEQIQGSMAGIADLAQQAVASQKQLEATTAATAEQARIQVRTQVEITEETKASVNASIAQKAAAEAYTAELNKQNALLRQQTLMQRQTAVAQSGTAGMGAVAGLGGNVAKGLLGTGLAGSVAGGLLAGAGIVAVIEMAGSALQGFLTHLREVTVEAGKLEVLRDVFTQLAAGRGMSIDQSTAFLDQLTDATRHLVNNITLLRDANIMLRSPVQLTRDQMVQLTADVTKLSLAAGETAEQGMERLARGLERGNLGVVGMTLQIPGLMQAVRSIPPGMSAVERETRLVNIQMEMLHQQAQKIKDIPETLDQVMTRFASARSDVELAFGGGFQTSSGTQAFLKDIDELSKRIDGFQDLAREAGAALGNMFAAVVPAAQAFARAAEDVWNALVKVHDIFAATFGAEQGSAGAIKTFLAMMVDNWILIATAISVAARALQGFLGTLAAGVPLLKAQVDAIRAFIDYHELNFSAALQDAKNYANDIGDSATGVKKAWETAFKGMGDSVVDEFQRAHDAIARMFTDPTFLQQFISQLKTNMPHAYASAAEAAAAGLFGPGALQPPDKQPPDLSQQLREAQARMQDQIAQAKERLDQKKEEISQLKALDDDYYKYADESLQQHYATQQRLIDEEYKAEQENARDNYATQKAMYEKQFGADAQVLADKIKTLDAKLADELNAAFSKHQMGGIQLLASQMKDEQEATQKAIEGQLKQTSDAVADAEKKLQTQLQQGETSPDAYFAKQIELTEQLAQARIDAANREYQNSAQNDAARQTRINAINAAIDQATAKIDELQSAEAQVRMQYVERQFQPQQQAIQAQIGGMQPGENPAGLQQQMLTLLQAEREELEKQAQALVPQTDGWYQILDKIEQVYQTQQKYNDELRKSTDLSQNLAGLLGGMSKLVGDIWTSRFVKGLTAGMSGAVEALKGGTQAAATVRNAIRPGSVDVPKDPQMLAMESAARSFSTSTDAAKTGTDDLTAEFGKARDALEQQRASTGNMQSATDTVTIALHDLQAEIQDLIAWLNAQMKGGPSTPAGSAAATLQQAQGPSSGLDVTEPTDNEQIPSEPMQNLGNLPTQSAMPSMSGFIDGLTAAIGELASFADAVSHSTSALGGAISGATAGAGVGQMLQGLGLPFGQAIGAVAGALVGAIAGQKNAEMSSELSSLNTAYTSIMDAFHSNTDNLQATISQLEELMEQAQIDEANSKKGSQQFASLVSQYSQQLIQLQDQQSSVISSLEVQLGIFQTPTGMQQFLTNLQQIIDQYDKFAGAAENASQLAQANSWLTDSLSSYTTQMENTFVQDEEQGIEDALNLNSLLSERSTLISNLNTSIMGVLEQGVLTRQQTQAQTKGQQIEQLESQASLQLTSINNEISLEQYKVGIETSLYNLGMTSMALQAQLLALQEGQASQSLAAIAALAELIQLLQGGSYNFTTISGILAGLGYAGAAGNIPPSGILPGGSAPAASTNAMDALMAAAYQSRATLGYGVYRGQTL